MASESSDERGLTVSVPASVDEWLDAKAAELDVDRETVVVQLLAAYRAAGDLDDGTVGSVPVDVEDEVRDVIAKRLPDIVDAVAERIDHDDSEAEAIEDSLRADISSLQRDVDRVEDDLQTELEDVRERVIQVKRETDGKAPADHTHKELATLGALSTEVSDLADRIDDLAAAVEGGAEERAAIDDRVDDFLDRVEDTEERLRTVAWVVSDLRDNVESTDVRSRALDGLKQAAVEADIDRAVCDSCEKPVEVALLTEPNCPHCEATVNDVEPGGRFFGKPRLTVAKQLESGKDDDHEDADVPDAARRNE